MALFQDYQVNRYQKGKTNLDFTEARDSEWQWHQLGHMQVCTSLQTDNHDSIPPLIFYRPSCHPTNSVKALKEHIKNISFLQLFLLLLYELWEILSLCLNISMFEVVVNSILIPATLLLTYFDSTFRSLRQNLMQRTKDKVFLSGRWNELSCVLSCLMFIWSLLHSLKWFLCLSVEAGWSQSEANWKVWMKFFGDVTLPFL